MQFDLYAKDIEFILKLKQGYTEENKSNIERHQKYLIIL